MVDVVEVVMAIGILIAGLSLFYFTLTKSFTGDKAWNRIKEANMFNDPPPEGMEYLLLYAEVDYFEGPSDEALQLSQWDFRIVSDGQIIDPESIVEPDPAFDINFFSRYFVITKQI